MGVMARRGVISNGWGVGIKTWGGEASRSDGRWRQLCLYEQTLEFIVLHTSCAPPSPSPSPPNIKWPPPQSGEVSSPGNMCTGAHTDFVLYTQIHTLTHILSSWSDDIINNHYWDTRKCRDLRLRVWLHRIRLACWRWEIWRGKHPLKLFYL